MMSRNIVLAGMMGSGKSTVARELGVRLGRRWVDTDAEIEQWTGDSISALFARRGESAFRALENTVVTRLATCHDLVIALGGGAVLADDNMAALRLTSVTVLLDVPIDELMDRLEPEVASRPLLAGDDDEWRGRLAATFRQRHARYRDVADVVVGGARPVDEIVDEIVEWAMLQGDILTPSEHEQVMTSS